MDSTTSASSAGMPLIERLLKEACEDSTKTSAIRLISCKALFGYDTNGKAHITSWHRIDSSEPPSSRIVYDPSLISDHIYGPNQDPSLEQGLASFIFSSPKVLESTRKSLSEAFFPDGQLLEKGEGTYERDGPVTVRTSRKTAEDRDQVSVMIITFDGDIPGWPQRSPRLQAASEGLNVYEAYDKMKKDEMMRAWELRR